MGAYSLEKLRVPGYKVLFKIVIIGLMFVPPVAQIPIYIVMSKLGFLNTYYALIVPNLAAPMYLFLMKQFISQLPDILLESARIDGAGEWRIYWRIIMPMIKPAWSTVVVFSFIANWNNSGSSVVYITNQAMKTLPYALTSIGNGTLGAVGAMSAASLLVTIPTIVIYLLMQRQVLNTMAFAGIKG
jgi:ABC-type glycerol-3-phosphate transport system permease component